MSVDARAAQLEQAARLACAVEGLARARLVAAGEPSAVDEALWTLADALRQVLEAARAPADRDVS